MASKDSSSQNPRAAKSGLQLIRRLPSSWQPYAQLAHLDLLPAALMMFWPCMWALTAVATSIQMPVKFYVLESLRFLTWSILCHSSACGWDDICDRKLDPLVERTKYRPLAAGTITTRNALIFTFASAFLTIFLMWGVNDLTMKLHILCALFLSYPYPYMKRLTYWPQAFLGLAMNCGIILAWSSMEHPDWTIMIPLYVAAWSWTVYYDTVYAMMDRKDDIKAGNKSTAVIFGAGLIARWMLTLFAAGTVLGLLFFGIWSEQHAPYFVFTVGVTTLHLGWQIISIDLNDMKSCMRRFLSNGTQVGGIIWAGLFVNYVTVLWSPLAAH